MTNIDLIIVAIYLSALFIWAVYIGIRETSDDFLIFSRKAPLFLVTFSIISTWVGIGTTVATASSGYDSGISLGLTAASGGFLGIIVAAWFAPILKWFGDKYHAYTLGDFFLNRYSKSSYLASSGLIVLVYLMLTAAQLVGLATLIEVWTGTEFKILIIFAAISTVVYTAFAGIKSDFYTDVVHFFVMFFVLFLVLLPITIKKLGGISRLLSLPPSYFDPFAYGGVSFFIAGLIFGAGSVFVTMELWQRIYASSSGKGARYSLIISIFVILSFYAVSALFGMSTRILIPNITDRDQVLFVLMKECLPTGLLGLGISAFLAIFISTINSTIMVASATITNDFYKNIFAKKTNEKSMLTVGRISTFISGILGLCFAILIPDLVALSVNSLFMLLVLLPAVVGGFFWKKGTSTGSTVSIFAGIFVVMLFLCLNPETAFVPGFIVSLSAYIIVSLLTRHVKSENLDIVKGWSNV